MSSDPHAILTLRAKVGKKGRCSLQDQYSPRFILKDFEVKRGLY